VFGMETEEMNMSQSKGLVPKPIVDSLGRDTIKWVKPVEATDSGRISRLGATPLPAVSGDKSEVLYHDQFVTVQNIPSAYGGFVTVQNAHGKGSAVVIVNNNNEMMLVSQDRPAVGERNWEIPKGASNDNEDLSETAQREVMEETGIDLPLESIIALGNVQPDTARMVTRAGTFFARTNQTGSDGLDEAGEIASKGWFPVEDVVNACLDGTIEDSFTIVAVLRARVRGLI